MKLPPIGIEFPTARRTSLVAGLAVLSAIAWASFQRQVASRAAEVAVPNTVLPEAPPPAAAVESIQPGLALTVDVAGKTDTRVARLAAISVPQGAAPTPFLPPGPFKATWEGEITVPLRGDFVFSAAGAGKITVKIGEKIALEASGDELDPATAVGESTRLKKGKNPITVTYQSPAKGDATIRLYWASPGEFAAEPIDPIRFSHNAGASAIAAATRVRHGRDLFAELRCAKCHALDAPVPTDAGMPEMQMDAPSLENLGSRLNEAWIAKWVASPHALRPDTSMPALFKENDPAPGDIAAYLASQGAKPGNDAFIEPKPDEVKAGGKLIATLGCIGCHTLPDAKPDAAVDAKRVPWRNVQAKFKPGALVAFLKQPEAHFQWIRMPNFHLSDSEAAQIAAYLLAGGKPFAKSAGGDPARGEKAMASAGCLSCHSNGPKLKIAPENSLHAPALAAIPRDGWSHGCMATDAAGRGKAPNFSLTGETRTALLAFAATDRRSLNQDAWPEFAERQITSLRCIACHNRDEKTDLWDDLIKETKALGGGEQANVESDQANAAKGPPGEPAPGSGDQTRPTLTWTGEKLQTDWAEAFIAGKTAYKPRVWLTARMPSFASRAHGLATGMSLEHGFAVTAPPAEQPDADTAAAGRKLSGRDGGFGCIQCHGIAKVPPLAPFEAPSINFVHVTERLRKHYFDRWMRNPARIVPTTKMPAFADTDMKTSLTDVLEGDASKQFNALWQYLLAGDKIQPPEDAPQ